MESGHETRPSVSGHGRNISGLTLSETFLHSPKIGYPQQTLRGATPSHRCVTPKVQKFRDTPLKSLSLPPFGAVQAHVAPVWPLRRPTLPLEKSCPGRKAFGSHTYAQGRVTRGGTRVLTAGPSWWCNTWSRMRYPLLSGTLVASVVTCVPPRCGSRRRWLPRRHPLRAAVAERSEAGRHLIAAVRRTREAGMPWSAIGSSIRHQRPSRATAPRQECRLNYNTGPEHRGRSARSASLSSPSAAS